MHTLPRSQRHHVAAAEGNLQIQGSAQTNTITSTLSYQEQLTPNITVGAQANANTAGQRDWSANITVSW